MYDNVGRSIKTLAKVIAFLGVAMCVIGAIIIMAPAGNINSFSNELANSLVISGLLIGVLGSLLCIILSFFMYGFGQIIESTQNIEKKVVFEKTIEEIKREEYPELSDDTYNSIVNSNGIKYCDKCGAKLDNNARFCSDCGETVI